MGTSIVIDYTRSRILYKAARKYKSQALEADALHFSTDIWSSSVVILGLIGLTIARYVPGLDWMHKADSIAALVVAVIVIYVSGATRLADDLSPAGYRPQRAGGKDRKSCCQACRAWWMRMPSASAHPARTPSLTCM